MITTAVSRLTSGTSKSGLAIMVLTILYIIGIVGIYKNIHPDFILLTPLNLLISLLIVLAFHSKKQDKKLRIFLVISYFAGFSAELYGVQTGQLFGEYAYGRVLGLKLWDTPLMIGVNWMLLSYSIGVTTNHLFSKWHWLFKGIIASLFMVGLDILIEPVAIRYDFWSWAQGTPPLQNYIGWFFVSLPLLSLFAKMQGEIRNKVAIALFVLQILFFFTLNLV
ncbi:MAG: carotenoid biosynthesis protein [Saprospiraceae bacterium]